MPLNRTPRDQQSTPGGCTIVQTPSLFVHPGQNVRNVEDEDEDVLLLDPRGASFDSKLLIKRKVKSSDETKQFDPVINEPWFIEQYLQPKLQYIRSILPMPLLPKKLELSRCPIAFWSTVTDDLKSGEWLLRLDPINNTGEKYNNPTTMMKKLILHLDRSDQEILLPQLFKSDNNNDTMLNVLLMDDLPRLRPWDMLLGLVNGRGWVPLSEILEGHFRNRNSALAWKESLFRVSTPSPYQRGPGRPRRAPLTRDSPYPRETRQTRSQSPISYRENNIIEYNQKSTNKLLENIDHDSLREKIKKKLDHYPADLLIKIDFYCDEQWTEYKSSKQILPYKSTTIRYSRSPLTRNPNRSQGRSLSSCDRETIEDHRKRFEIGDLPINVF